MIRRTTNPVILELYRQQNKVAFTRSKAMRLLNIADEVSLEQGEASDAGRDIGNQRKTLVPVMRWLLSPVLELDP